jgi:outer membrane receptor protein involved in Fe transport
MASITGQTGTNFYNQYASMMFGLVRNMGKSIQNEVFSVYEWTHALFLRDRWNVTQRLTFDLGLRYEVYPVMRRATRGMEMLDLDTLEIVIGGRGPDNPATALDEGSETLGVHAEKDLIAPRFGAIYRLNEKTVTRVGYGLAFSGKGFTRPFRGDASYPGALNVAFNALTDGNQNWGWLNTLQDGIPFIELPSNDLVRQPLPVDSANTRTMVP